MTIKEGKNIKIELSEEEITRRLDQIEQLACDDDLREFLISILQAVVRLDEIIGMKETTIARLRKIFGKKSEKLIGKIKKPNKKHPGRNDGQGNNGSREYPNAKHLFHKLEESLQAGNKCPLCSKGTLYKYSPGIFVRITGGPSLTALVHETEKTRCSGCGMIFEADFAGKDDSKYDEKAISIIAILHYLASIPFYRLGKIQKFLKTPMPRSVQWSLMETLANDLLPVWKSLINYAREADLFYSDDTGGKIISVMLDNKRKKKGDRKKISTTGVIAKRDGVSEYGKPYPECILFFTGLKYSGENFDELLNGRESKAPVALMSDALPQNNPKKFAKIVHYLCLAHGRRKFEDLAEMFQDDVNYIKGQIAIAYKNDKYCKKNNLKGADRLLYHQKHSALAMMELHEWCFLKFSNREIEPNSALGKGIKYLLKHWEGLTGFLYYENAPLDNNKLEAALRTPVLNRKNWLFFQNEIGAFVGDIILSVLKTCETNKVDPFEYLSCVQKNREDAKANPLHYLPWNFLSEDKK